MRLCLLSGIQSCCYHFTFSPLSSLGGNEFALNKAWFTCLQVQDAIEAIKLLNATDKGSFKVKMG